jgi:hypothetical protein
MKLRGGTGIFFLEDCHWFFSLTCQPTQVWFKEVMRLLLHIIPMVLYCNPALANLAGPNDY